MGFHKINGKVAHLNFVSLNTILTIVTADFKEFAKEEQEKLIATTIEDDYKNFLDQHEEDMEKEFGEKHNFQASIRGIKVKIVFPTQEAELRCKMLDKLILIMMYMSDQLVFGYHSILRHIKQDA